MTQFINIILPNLFLIHLIGVLNPGPNLFYIIDQSISDGKRKAFLGLFGIAIGYLLFASISFFGIAEIFETNKILYKIAKYLGVSYFVYSGIKGFIRAGNKIENIKIGHNQTILHGFLISISNIASMFNFLAILALSLPYDTSFGIKLICIIYMTALMTVVFSVIIFIFDNKVSKNLLTTKLKIIKQCMSICLIISAIKIAFGK